MLKEEMPYLINNIREHTEIHMKSFHDEIYIIRLNMSSTIKFLIVDAALIRMKKIISQCPMSKFHLRLLLEVLREKLNQRTRLSISTVGSDHPTLHVQCSYKDMPYESI